MTVLANGAILPLMRRRDFPLYGLLILFLSALGFAEPPAHEGHDNRSYTLHVNGPTPKQRAQKPHFGSVQDLLNLQANQVDIGFYALSLAKEIYPDLNVAAYSAKIDKLALQVRQLAGNNPDPEWRVRCLNTIIYLQGKYHGSRDAVYSRNEQYFHLNHLLDTKQGNCFSMPLLYVAVAQRLGWPIYPVAVPDHMFVRYADPAFKQQNIETTSGGGYEPDESYAKDFKVSKLARAQGTYLRTMSYRELLAHLVENNGVWIGRHGQLAKAMTYFEVATKLGPKDDGAWWNLGAANKTMARRSTLRSMVEKYQAVADECSRKLRELGSVPPWEVPVLATMGGKAGPPPPPPAAFSNLDPDPRVLFYNDRDPIPTSRRAWAILPDGTPLDPDIAKTGQPREASSWVQYPEPSLLGDSQPASYLSQISQPGGLYGSDPASRPFLPGGVTPNPWLSKMMQPRRPFGGDPYSRSISPVLPQWPSGRDPDSGLSR